MNDAFDLGAEPGAMAEPDLLVVTIELPFLRDDSEEDEVDDASFTTSIQVSRIGPGVLLVMEVMKLAYPNVKYGDVIRVEEREDGTFRWLSTISDGDMRWRNLSMAPEYFESPAVRELLGEVLDAGGQWEYSFNNFLLISVPATSELRRALDERISQTIREAESHVLPWTSDMRTPPVRIRVERDIRQLARPDGRRVGRPGHDVARRYLLARLERMRNTPADETTDARSLEPLVGQSFELPYFAPHPVTGAETAFVNLVAVIRGTEAGLPPLLVGAHYDSVIDAPCADDNAAAVAVALAVAETCLEMPLRRDVVIALFDAEEPPYFLSPAMGSIRFYEEHCSGIDFQCAVIMDLVGHDVELGDARLERAYPEIRDLLVVLGSESGMPLPAAVEKAAAAVDDLGVLPTLNSYIGDMSDHHAFRMGGQPYLFLTCGQGRYYHTAQDEVDWLNLDKVGRVHGFVMKLLRELDEAVVGPGGAGEPQVDFEIRMIARALGGSYGPLLGSLGLEGLSGRDDVDRLVLGLASRLIV